MSMVKINFGHDVGPMKPLHGVNNGPKTRVFDTDMSAHFVAAAIPYARLHDTEYPYGSGHFVDIPCVFPDFAADPDDPAAYDFALTDEYIKAIHAVGARVMYRLGVSIEHAPKKYHIFPPRDVAKWARICAGIVRHYNHGWADGHRYGIEYWEIWNEPENPPMWQGSKEEYFRLYVETARHLKACFPEIKVGGYGGCGFYALTRPGTNDFQQVFVTYFADFLACLAAPETRAPLDFFSWHLYSDSIAEMASHAAYVEETLASHGFGATENILDEWNYMDAAWSVLECSGMTAAAYVAGAFCALQASPVDLAMYYDAQPSMTYCGIFDYRGPRKPFQAFRAFNELHRLGRAVSASSDLPGIHVCAATSEAQGAMLLVNYGGEDQDVAVEMSGLAAPRGVRLEYHCLDESRDLEMTRSETYHGETIGPVVHLARNTVALVKMIRL
jgi:hypothetical protein